MKKENVIDVLEKNKSLRDKLFCRGFLITNGKVQKNDYPFYGKWKSEKFLDTEIIYHKDSFFYKLNISEERCLCLIGHAFNIVSMEYDENEILLSMAKVIDDKESFYEYIADITGVFILFEINKNAVRFLHDAVGLQSVYYTLRDGTYYIASHVNLIGDILSLEESKYVKKLKKCKEFYLLGNQLPGDITPFDEVKRLSPNYLVTVGDNIDKERFYFPHYLNVSKEEILDNLIKLLENTMELIAIKWKAPAISLTGGCDSKTTLACSHKLYDKFKYYSYTSSSNEKVDAEAAEIICKNIGLKHKTYIVSENDDDFENLEDIRTILNWNAGDIRATNENDVRKRAYFDKVKDFDVEIKSWGSEIGRARYTKRFNGKRNFGKKPTPRKCTSFYKFLFFNRFIVHKTDKIFKNFIKDYYQTPNVNAILWPDWFYWEYNWPSRDGITLTNEHRYSSDIVIPYNNRRILEYLLSMPEEDRINDTIYYEIRNKLNPKIDLATKNVVDVNHTKKRAIFETLFYIINTHLPF